MKSLEIEFAELWCEATIKGRKLKSTPALKKKLTGIARKYHFSPSTQKECAMFLRRDSKARLRAVVFIGPEASKVKSKKKILDFVIHSVPDDKESLAWAKSILEDQISLLVQGCKGLLQPWQISLVPWLFTKGIGTRSIRLEGDVKKSLRKLRAHYGSTLRVPFERDGLNLRPGTLKEVEAYLRIVRDEFRRNPQYGHFIASSKFIQYMRTDLNDGIKRGKKALWLVYKGKKLIGGADILEFPKGFDGKSRAAFGMSLSKEAQGKNYSRVVYEAILNELTARGIETYFGNTAQTGVMRIGKIMGRKLVNIEVDRGVTKSFPRNHFKNWVPS